MSPIDLQRVKVSLQIARGDQGAAADARPHHQPHPISGHYAYTMSRSHQ